MKNLVAVLAVAGLAAAASAQTSAPVVSWEASADGGATWTNALVLASGQNVLVRGRLSWIGAAGTAMASVSLDGVITGNVAGEAASGFNKPVFQTVGSETVTAYARPGQIKISNSLDGNTTDAGDNTTWLTIGADAAVAAGSNFNSSNPITFLTYSINVDSSLHVLTVSSIMNPAGTTATNNRAVRIFNSDGAGGTLGTFSTFNRNSVTVTGATISVIPTPGTLALAGLGGLAAARRRR